MTKKGKLESLAVNEMKVIMPPVAEKIPKVDTLHGEERIDYYYWLRERENPKVIEYLKAENAYTEKMVKHTEALREKLFQELLGRIKETDLSVPEKIDDYYYYSRTEEGKQYRFYCRKKGTLEAEEEVLLDVNALAEDHEYMRIGIYEISPNHRLLAFSTDTTGGERYTIHIKDLTTNKLLEDEIPTTYYSVRWANDNETVFYTTLDEAHRPHKLYRHKLGEDPKEDVLVFHEEDEAFFLYISKTKSKRYLLMDLESITTSEVWYLDADNPTGEFKVIHPRQHEMEYSVSHHGEKFYIVTNNEAKNFKLMEVSVSEPSKKNWKVVLPHRKTVKVDRIDVFRNHLVVYERKKGLKEIRVMDLKNGEYDYVKFPEPVFTFWPGRNRDFNTHKLRFTYTSLITPRSVYDYDMDKKTQDLKKEYEVLGGYDRSLYRSERTFAKAHDGIEIPISLVYRKGIVKEGSNPLLLYGYGSYGSSWDPSFSSHRLSLLDRGFILAIAHVRGGGEMGREWYEEGK
ncbi:S9 family peptidase, partial [candidate division TA06 bacterium]|nr:S9 family peptidase [candidate division TA06 bacterium]